MLTANPDLKAIYSACGPPALGAIQSIKNAGIKPGGIILVGFDGLPDEITAIKAGTESAQPSPSSRSRSARSGSRRSTGGARADGAEEHRHRNRDHHEGERLVVLSDLRRSRQCDVAAPPGISLMIVDAHHHFWNPGPLSHRDG